jgi:DNA polymerase III subunit epsilon
VDQAESKDETVGVVLDFFGTFREGALMVKARGGVGDDFPNLGTQELEGSLGIAGFIDVETTGLNSNFDEVVELAIILFAYERETGHIVGIVEEYVGLREPSKPISPGATRVNGITMDEVRGKVLDDEKIIGMIERAEFLVAHNASFDKGFVCRIYRNAKAKLWICSMRGINWYEKGCNSRGLQNLLLTHGIKVANAHRADADVKAALRLLSLLGPNGKSYLAELLPSAAATSE